ncbi:retrovirus-related pol polyprotein from transposon TNT 1-94 [Tanacetum coccineum]|uniref:Retrovirus-related pol polyprotein from transposon TNT 1-94 n=1 Tax=Tanacetum coccineum TaxID=301880 RepID=A0ABQ4YX22_9ASTR
MEKNKLHSQDQSIQTVHMMLNPAQVYDQRNKTALGAQNHFHLRQAKKAQPALYDGEELLKTHHVPVNVPSSEEELELAEATRNKLHVKMNDSACVEKRVNITPPNYSKENFMATFTPQTQLTPEQVFWSLDLAKRKAEELKANAPPLPVLPPATVYPPNTSVHLVPRTLPTTSQVNIGLYVITQLFWDFEKTCKKRITPTGITEGERGFEQTKRCYLTEVIPFFNLLKEHFDGVQKSLVTEVMAMKVVFENLEAEGIPPKVLPTKQWKPTGRLLPLGRQCPLVRSTALKSDCLPADPQEPVAPVAYNLACTNQPDPNCNWGSNVSNSPFSPLFKCRNFGKKCLFGTVRFGNDHFGAIMRYVDYVIDLEVAFRKHTCFVQDLDGVDRIKGSRVDDYSRFTWVKFLRSKDETPIFVINLLKQLQVGLNKTVWFVRTDFGTEFVNKNLLISMKCVALLTRRTFRELSAEMGLLNEESHLLKLLGYVIFSKASIVFFGAAAVAGQRYKGAWRISGISPVCFN